jgi:hypothetical protein
VRLVTDPIEVQRLAGELQDENWAFRAWIKSNLGMDDEQLMSVVHWLAEDATAQIDCTVCANCCQVLAPSLNQEDMKGLARALPRVSPSAQRLSSPQHCLHQRYIHLPDRIQRSRGDEGRAGVVWGRRVGVVRLVLPHPLTVAEARWKH